MEQIAINILPKGAKPVCHSSQFDEGRQIMFNLFNDKTPYTLSGTETISVLVRKPDGAEVVDSVVNTSDSYVIWDVSADACELSGVCECELSIVKNGILLGSKNFTMKVEEDAYGGRTIEVRTASGRIATFSTNMVEAFKSLKTAINPVQDLHGYSKPWSGGGGKNKLNYNVWKNSSIAHGTAVWENNGVTLTATANDCYTQAPNGFPSGAIIPISEGETITLSWEETTNKSGLVVIFPNGTTTGMVRAYNQQVKKLSYTATSGVTYVTFRFGVSNSGDTIAYKNIQIEKGSQETSWEPYENICPISGFSALNVTRTGKNWANNTATSQTISGVAYTVATDGKITANGTASGASIIDVGSITLLGGNSYVLSGCPSGGSGSTYALFLRGSGSFAQKIDFGGGNSFTVTDTVTTLLSIIVYNGYTASDLTFEPMVRLSDTTADFEPYNGQTATVNFGQTVYGGVADIAGGSIVSKMQFFDIANANITKNNTSPNDYLYYATLGTTFDKNGHGICSHLQEKSGAPVGSTQGFAISPQFNVVYINVGILAQNDVAGFKDFCANNNVQLLLDLLTPIEITTTPENLSALSGQNNVYSDTNGDTTVEYYIEV